MLKKLTIAVTAALTVGCASTSINNETKEHILTNTSLKQPLVKAQIMPTMEELKGKKIKVLVLDAEEKNTLAKEANAGEAMFGSLNNVLNKAGVEIVDRSIASKVKNEILAYETSGQYNNSEFGLADVSILPVISSATFSYDYTAAHQAKDVISGKQVWVAASCTLKGEVQGVAKVYSLPEIKVTSTTTLDGVSTITRDAQSSSCNISTLERLGLVAQASSQAVRNYKQAIQNKFSPKGYVTEYKVYDNKHYVKINLGINRQLVEGSSINFVRQLSLTDDLTGETTTDKLPLGEGEVTNLILETSAWVLVDEEIAPKLMLGDVAQVEFKKGVWDHLNSASQMIQSL